ncbi:MULTISPECIES: hypothetical protein [unclassified Rhizobium]|uniref:hypothetical protein n=1 Tax=unclassified Rhizobium TaxID=2613769 RepID=UPI001ADD39E0|nr:MULTISPECIES: hypothetical protein [unclassified Rhizobium]MBO9102012.1 hypothetical protein [Rhizobium sp. L58/93]MBO9136180.1 hypothetical protein [Rhizobium sp. B209b/85]MBO9171866.1 hypothetical protein [Rhizobium sp. L245/93]MBO9187962.1 hypothetical protein [Rhizobium sp. E27B/91]QXZ86049.1 hypothetical protein J5287_23375 [Rhizobium sp. K1/93]
MLRSYQMSGGDAGFFLTRPIALVMLALLVALLVWPAVRAAISRSRHTKVNSKTTS